MRVRIVFIRHYVPEFPLQLRVHQRFAYIRRQPMTIAVGRIVRESAERKCVFIQRLGIPDQRLNEISGAHIMRQIAEISVAVRIVAHVLKNRSAIGVGMRLFELLRCCVWKALEQCLLQPGIPQCIDDCFV